MKYGYLLLLCALVVVTGFRCEKEAARESDYSTCFKGRLEIKGVCMNYTIKVLEGNIDPSLIQATWTNPQTNITYENVFGLANTCNFPPTIAEGDEFYFVISEKPLENCGVCQAFYPTPGKKLYINASKSPCL